MNKEKISILSILVNAFLAAIKLFIGLLSGSSAILAEGIHSGMDIVSSTVNYIGIKVAKKPVDKRHPYGYYKSEVIAGFIITIMLFAASLWILYEAVMDFFGDKILEVSYLALGVMVFSGVINEVMARLKFKYGKEQDAVSLVADAVHSRMDVLTSAGVLVGLILSNYWIYADSVAAIAIGIYILKESIELGKETTDSLLDVSAGEEIEKRIKDVTEKEGIQVSDIKTRKVGSDIFAELKIKLDSKLKVEDASRISKGLEMKLMKSVPGLKYVVIQVDSHDVKQSYYRGGFGRMIGWRGRMGGSGMGPSGECVCPSCGYKVPHERGVPCATVTCPKCGSKMIRAR